MPDDVDHSSAAGRLCTPRPTASTGLGQDPCGATASSPRRVVAARGATCCPGRPRACYDHGLGQRHASPGQVRPTWPAAGHRRTGYLRHRTEDGRRESPVGQGDSLASLS